MQITPANEAFKSYLEIELQKVLESAQKQLEEINKETENLVHVVKHHLESKK